jgi:phosphoribosylformimino-5-aminoimidazole carboxamide ribotide isomerase
MDVIPAIDLRDGCCVRLFQGDYDRETVFSDDPVATAQRWAAEGAPRLHVVDLDGARAGRPVNDGAVRNIIGAAGVPVQVAGGVRKIDDVDAWTTAGADRVVLGTAALRDEGLVREACRRYGERIVVSLDARDGILKAQGWTESTGERAEDALRRLEALGVRRFVFTDIGRDATLTSPNLEAIGALLSITKAALIASGGVASVEHIARLAELGVEGVIVGMALYDGRLRLPDALAAARER